MKQPVHHFAISHRCNFTNVIVLLGTVVFGLTGLAKVAILLPFWRASLNPALDYPNPVFEIVTNRTALTLAAGLEIGVAIIAVRTHRSRPCVALGFLAWCALLLAVYRLLLTLTGVPAICGCLGAIGKLLYPRDGGDALAQVLLYSVLVLSCAGFVGALAEVTADASLKNSEAGTVR